jgi:hypothetical protein
MGGQSLEPGDLLIHQEGCAVPWGRGPPKTKDPLPSRHILERMRLARPAASPAHLVVTVLSVNLLVLLDAVRFS